MKSAIRFAFLLAAAVLFLTAGGCDNPPPRKAPSPKGQQATTDTAPPPPAVRETRAAGLPWPPVAEGDVEIARNLLMKNYYVILDCSGSMQEKQCYGEGAKLTVAQDALIGFSKLVPENANLGLTIFINNQIQELVPLGQNNRPEFILSVRRTYPSGETPLRSAIKTGFRKLTEQAGKQLGYGEYTLVLVTDGMASKGEDPTDIVQEILDRTPVEIHTIGFCIGENHPLNIPGRTVYKAANSQADLQRGLEDVLAESEAFDVSNFGRGE